MGKVHEELVKVNERGTITIPSEIRKAVGLAGNDMVLVAASEDGNSILIKPQVAIDKSQAWFWTEGWQSEEKKSAEDFEAGRVTRTTAKEFLEEIGNW
jgi:AbrB family looped-hinge helix DNA binding protein